MLEAIPTESIASYQPFWALAASLLSALGREEDAQPAYDRAIGLCENQAMSEFLMRKASRD